MNRSSHWGLWRLHNRIVVSCRLYGNREVGIVMVLMNKWRLQLIVTPWGKKLWWQKFTCAVFLYVVILCFWPAVGLMTCSRILWFRMFLVLLCSSEAAIQAKPWKTEEIRQGTAPAFEQHLSFQLCLLMECYRGWSTASCRSGKGCCIWLIGWRDCFTCRVCMCSLRWGGLEFPHLILFKEGQKKKKKEHLEKNLNEGHA